jgi:flagellar biosynthesis/type III secretory pathway chaperone
MVSPALPDRDLAGLLDEQIRAMESVLAALDAERDALRERDGAALLAAVDRKAAQIAAASAVEQRRRTVFAELGIGEGPVRGPREFSADVGLHQRWHQVVALTRRCQAANDANGHLIRSQRRRIDGALAVLRGEPAATAAEYGPAGEFRHRHASRALGSV